MLPVIKALHRGDKTLALFPAQQCFTGNMDIVHHDIGDMTSGLAHLLVRLAHRDARRVHRHHEGGDMGVFGQGVLVGPGHDQRHLGEGGIGDVALGPAQNVTIARTGRSGLHRRGV